MGMISSQLGRALLSGPALSADEHVAATNEQGGYGELIEAIDRILEQLEADQGPRPEEAA